MKRIIIIETILIILLVLSFVVVSIELTKYDKYFVATETLLDKINEDNSLDDVYLECDEGVDYLNARYELTNK